jgi:hypothetical protein
LSDRYPEAIQAFAALMQEQSNAKGEYHKKWENTTREERHDGLQREIIEYYEDRFDPSEAAQVALCLVMELYMEGKL